jgi:hypothetical protein
VTFVHFFQKKKKKPLYELYWIYFFVTNWSKIASKKTTLDSGDFFENWVLIRNVFFCVLQIFQATSSCKLSMKELNKWMTPQKVSLHRADHKFVHFDLFRSSHYNRIWLFPFENYLMLNLNEWYSMGLGSQ